MQANPSKRILLTSVSTVKSQQQMPPLRPALTPDSVGVVTTSFGARLNLAMEERMIRPNELERMAPLTTGHASLLTTGKRKTPTLPTMQKLAKTLGVHRLWLEEGVGPMLSGSQSDRPGFREAEEEAYELNQRPDWAIAGVKRLPWDSSVAPGPISAAEILQLASVVEQRKKTLTDAWRKQLDKEAREAQAKRRAKPVRLPGRRPSRPAGKNS